MPLRTDPPDRPIVMTDVDFAWGSTLVCERDRPSELPVVRNGPPGTFLIVPAGVRISLPTDQIASADDGEGRARVGFGGMRFDGSRNGRLKFSRVRELHPEDQLSPDRSHTMWLDPEWVSAVSVYGARAWPLLVYKIVPAALWRDAEVAGSFAGSPVDVRDGFIHFSTASQARVTAAKHFAGARDLLVVAVSIAALDLRWETSRGGDRFPHLYAPLPLTAVQWVRDLPLGDDERHQFPSLE